MDSVTGKLLGIFLVVVVMAAVFFVGVAPDLDTKQDGVMTEMNALDYGN